MRSGKLLLLWVRVIDKILYSYSEFNLLIQNLFQPAPVASPARDSAANTEEVKTLKYQITEAKREMQSRLPSLYCSIYIAVDVEFQNFCIYQKCVMCTCTSSNNLYLHYTKYMYLGVCGININLPKVHVQCIFNKILKQRLVLQI